MTQETEHAYKMAHRLFDAIGMFPWQDKWVQIERKFIQIAERKWPRDWNSLILGIRMHE